jgi:hypothetical protein
VVCTRDDRFCEDCGHELDGAAPVATTRWNVEVTADWGYFARMNPSGVTFPAVPVARSLWLDRGDILIGRRLGDHDEVRIDMAGPPEDGGVSHRHALLRCSDGLLTVTDVGSTNGTFVNDSPDALAPWEPVVLRDGDHVHVGAWTTIVARSVRADP